MQIENRMEKTAKKAQDLENAMRDLEKSKIPTDEYKEVQDQIQKAETKLSSLNDKMEKFTELGGKTDSARFKSMQYDMADLENTISYARGELEAMEEEGTAFKDVKATKEYQNLSDKLRQTNSEMNALSKKHDEIIAKQKKVGSGAKQIEKVGKSAKKASGLMSTLLSRLKGITLSLLVFNWITKGFNAMVAAFKDGIQNMAKYSGNFNSKMSEMKSAINTLKASLGTLAAPIVSAVVPAIVTLCNWLTTAINKINELIAAISGKSTWTKAKKQAADYAKALDKTSGSAKKAAGALAAFDDLNVLQKNDSSGGSSSGVSDLYEEVPTSSDLTKKLQPFLDYLKKTKASIEKGWSDTWKKLDISSQLANIKASADSIKNSLADIFADGNVLGAVDNFVQTVATSLGSIAASVVSIGATIAENLLGGIAIYLENNSENIKEYIVNMFDIAADIAELASQAAEVFAYVFSAFGDENGQQITANLIQIFTDIFGSLTLLVAQFGNDLLHLFIDPFVNNSEEIRTALDGLLAVVAEVTTTISEIVRQVTDGIVALYDEHISPFINSIKDGISELIAKFLEFWNTYMQPILEEWAAMFEDTYENHLKPVIDKVLECIGKIIDILKILWENWIQPFIAWIIDNILPVITPILSSLGKFVKGHIDSIIDFVHGLLSAVSDVLDVIIKLLKGDWKGAWESAKKVVKDVVNGILAAVESMANGVVNAINTMIRALNGLHFSIPDWVPGLGGKSFGFSLGEVSTVKLPRLANGGITTGRTLAEIGEAGREAVLPLENNTGWMDDLASKLASKMPDYSGAKTVVLAVDGKEFARINLPYLQDEEIRLGIAEG